MGRNNVMHTLITLSKPKYVPFVKQNMRRGMPSPDPPEMAGNPGSVISAERTLENLSVMRLSIFCLDLVPMDAMYSSTKAFQNRINRASFCASTQIIVL